MNDIEYLIQTCFNSDTSSSKETISHWQKYGKMQRVTFKSGLSTKLNQNNRSDIGCTLNKLKLHRGGFDNFKNLTIFHSFSNIPLFI